MLNLPQSLADQILEHAESDAPNECVGVVVCHVKTHECRVIRLRNSAEDPTETFDVAEKEVAKLYRELNREHEYVDVIYHSHTRVEAIPSKSDVENADLEEAHYLIVATASRGRRMRSWRIAESQAREEPLVLTAD